MDPLPVLIDADQWDALMAHFDAMTLANQVTSVGICIVVFLLAATFVASWRR